MRRTRHLAAHPRSTRAPIPTCRTTKAACRLYRALVLQNQMLVDTLLGMGANPNANDHRGDPLLFTAMSVGSGPGSIALINAKADAESRRDSIGHRLL